MTAKERYLKALEDPESGITLETPAHLIAGTVQKRFSDATAAGVKGASKMTDQQLFDQVEATAGWVDPERTRKAMGLPPKSKL
jgi:hypothetical protein